MFDRPIIEKNGGTRPPHTNEPTWMISRNSTYRDDEDSAVAMGKWIAYYENRQAAGNSSGDSAGDSTGAKSDYKYSSDDFSDDKEYDDDEADYRAYDGDSTLAIMITSSFGARLRIYI
jgi:hypothetical protein